MPRPAHLQNSHQNGGRIFLIFVTDPITVRLYIFDFFRSLKANRTGGHLDAPTYKGSS